MSGHSKWATTHRQKEANDAKRGAAFTKIANMISIAVKEGGGVGDPDKNFKLRLMMEKARAVNMPKDNIQRAIDRATGAGADSLVEAVFEGFLPQGVGVLAQTLSDNKLRSQQFVREVLEKNGGSLASAGAVSHGFKQMGELHVTPPNEPGRSLQDWELELMDVEGIEDMESDEEGGWYVWCDKAGLWAVKEKMDAAKWQVKSAELTMKPLAKVEVADTEAQTRIETILEKLEDLDDVAKVWTNYQPVSANA